MRVPSAKNRFFTLAAITLLLAACSPHPGAGNWQTEKENVYGIGQITVHFDGKADFSAAKPEKTDWHCFWGATGKNTLAFQCTPSTNPEREESFALSVAENGIAEFSHNGTVVGTFDKMTGR